MNFAEGRMTPQEESDDDYLDDPILLIDFESQGLQVQETGNPEECQGSQNLSYSGEEQDSQSTKFSNCEISRNAAFLNQCRPLSIKIVDCDKHPWYYKKYFKTVSDIISVDDDSMTDSAEESKDEKMNFKCEPSKKLTIRPVATPYKNLSNSNVTILGNKKISTKECWQVPTKPTKLEEKPRIDYKKNEGLVGMRIQYTEESVKTKDDTKRKERKSKKQKIDLKSTLGMRIQYADEFSVKTKEEPRHQDNNSKKRNVDLMSTDKVISSGSNISNVELSKVVSHKLSKGECNVTKSMDKLDTLKPNNCDQNNLNYMQVANSLCKEYLKSMKNKTTKSTKCSKEVVKSNCVKLHDNTNIDNVDMKTKIPNTSNTTKKLTKEQNEVDSNVKMSMLQQKIDEPKSVIKSNVIKYAHNHKSVAQKANKETSDREAKDTFARQSTKPNESKVNSNLSDQRSLPNLHALNNQNTSGNSGVVQNNSIKEHRNAKDTVPKLSRKPNKSKVNSNLTQCHERSLTNLVPVNNQNTYNHSSVVQSNNIKEPSGGKEKDTFTKQSTKQSSIQQSNANRDKQLNNSKNYSQLVSSTISKTSAADKSNVSTVVGTEICASYAEKNLTPKGTPYLEKLLATKPAFPMYNLPVHGLSAKQPGVSAMPNQIKNSPMYASLAHVSPPKQQSTSAISNQNTNSKTHDCTPPSISTAPTQNKDLNMYASSGQYSVQVSSANQITISATPKQSKDFPMYNSTQPSVSAMPSQNQMYVPPVQASSAIHAKEKQLDDMLTRKMPQEFSQNASVIVSMTAAPTSQVSYHQSVPQMPCQPSTAKKRVIVARNCPESLYPPNQMPPRTNISNNKNIEFPNAQYQNQYQNHPVDSRVSCLGMNRVSGILPGCNVSLNNMQSESSQIMNGQNSSVSPNVSITVKPSSSNSISTVANNLPPVNTYLTDVFNPHAKNYSNPVSHLSATNYAIQEFPIQTHISKKPGIRMLKAPAMQYNVPPGQRGPPQLYGKNIQQHVCAPIYDGIPKNVHTSNMSNMFNDQCYRPPLLRPPPPYPVHHQLHSLRHPPPPPGYPLPPYPRPQNPPPQSPTLQNTRPDLCPQNPPPQSPTLQNTRPGLCPTKSVAGTTIIGQNVAGPIRKINIASNCPKSQETPVNTKEKMIEELSKAPPVSPPVSPVKNTKRSLLETVAHLASNSSHDVKRPRPGPLSKKPKLDLHTSIPECKPDTPAVPHKGYSPPILPIPTYQKSLEILAQATSNMAGNRNFVESDKTAERRMSTEAKRKLLEDYNLDKSVKKISISEYKKRVTKSDEKKDERETLRANDLNKRNRSESADQDLGYDSDSTVVL